MSTRFPVVATCSARPHSVNEDAVAVAPDGRAAVLVDGAGLPEELRGGCRHTVDWFAGSMAAAMLARLTVRGAGSLSMTHALAAAIGDVLVAHGPGCRPEAGSPSSTLAAWRIVCGDELSDDGSAGTARHDADLATRAGAPRLSGPRIDWIVLADSSLFIRSRDGAVREVVDTAVDDIAGVRRAAAYDELLARGWAPHDAHVEAHRRTTERLRNVDGGFWCCHADPGAARHALTGSLPLPEVDALVLASDGLTRLVHPYGVLGAEELVEFCLSDAAGSSHEALFARLRAADVAHAEAAHADTAGRAIVKIHDDATLVAARFVDRPSGR